MAEATAQDSSTTTNVEPALPTAQPTAQPKTLSKARRCSPPRRRQDHHEVNDERWLISYSDFVTLLFAFFVVMYASSNVNEDKYQVLSDTLQQIFEESPRSITPIQVGEPMLAASTAVVDLPDASDHQDPNQGDTQIQPSKADILQQFAGLEHAEQVDVAANNDWLEISLSANLAFASGSARLTPAAQSLLTTTAEYLQGFSQPVTIEGYTDNVPTQSNAFPSNWALAGARASAVAQFFENTGIDRRRLSAVGYGDNHGLATNATPQGRDRNRRVVIVVARKGNLARDVNAMPGSSAFAYVRHEEPKTLDSRISQQRTASGSLLFSD